MDFVLEHIQARFPEPSRGRFAKSPLERHFCSSALAVPRPFWIIMDVGNPSPFGKPRRLQYLTSEAGFASKALKKKSISLLLSLVRGKAPLKIRT